MSEKYVDQEPIEINIAPGTIDEEAHQRGVFPHGAFSFQDVHGVSATSTPILTVVSPWQLEVASNVKIGGTATISGAVDINSDVNIAGTLTVTGGVTGDVTGTATTANGVVEVQSSASMKMKVFSIGAWDMASSTEFYISVGHNLTLSQIRSSSVEIVSDGGSYKLPLSYKAHGWHYLDYNSVELFRLTTGTFDSANYDSNGNRGWITIWYEE